MYEPNKYRIGKTPEWWKRFEEHETNKTKVAAPFVAFKQFSAYDEATGDYTDTEGVIYHYGPDAPYIQQTRRASFNKRNGSFEGLPIFGLSMKMNMDAWDRDYGRYIKNGAPFFMAQGLPPAEYHFPVDVEGEDAEILHRSHTVTVHAIDFPDPNILFPKDQVPRFGMHCVFNWFFTVSTWLNSLQRALAVISPLWYDVENMLADNNKMKGCYTSYGLDAKNTGAAPIWVQISHEDFISRQIGDMADYDVRFDGSIWYRGMPQFQSAGINYARTNRRAILSTVGLSQSGQMLDGNFTQEGIYEYPYPDPDKPEALPIKAKALIVSDAKSGIVRPGFDAEYSEDLFNGSGFGDLLRFNINEVGELKEGKWIGFSYGYKTADGSPGFDGWRGKLTVDGKEFNANIGESENRHNDVFPGYRGALFYEDATLDPTKHEWDFSLKADPLTIPEDAAGWEGGFTFLHGIFQLDLSAKLDLLE